MRRFRKIAGRIVLSILFVGMLGGLIAAAAAWRDVPPGSDPLESTNTRAKIRFVVEAEDVTVRFADTTNIIATIYYDVAYTDITSAFVDPETDLTPFREAGPVQMTRGYNDEFDVGIVQLIIPVQCVDIACLDPERLTAEVSPLKIRISFFVSQEAGKRSVNYRQITKGPRMAVVGRVWPSDVEDFPFAAPTAPEQTDALRVLAALGFLVGGSALLMSVSRLLVPEWHTRMMSVFPWWPKESPQDAIARLSAALTVKSDEEVLRERIQEAEAQGIALGESLEAVRQAAMRAGRNPSLLARLLYGQQTIEEAVGDPLKEVTERREEVQ